MKYVFAALTAAQMILTGLAMYLPDFSREAVLGCWIGVLFMAALAALQEDK